MNDQRPGALVALSGGDRSMLALAIARETFPRVEAITFDCGNEPEVARAVHTAGQLEMKHAMRPGHHGGPPGLNLMVFAMAAAHGLANGMPVLVVGSAFHVNDAPDNRPEFVGAIADAIRLAHGAMEFDIEAPLLYSSPPDIHALTEKYGHTVSLA